MKILDGGINDVRIIGLLTNIILLGIALIGMKWEAKVQIILLGALLVAFINFLIGSFLAPTPAQKAKGFLGYSGKYFLKLVSQ